MNHLPLPSSPTCTHDQVPLLCHPYDCIDFLTYPERAGPQWQYAIQSEWEHAFGFRERFYPSDVRELEKFLQCWLFFGLLHAVLGEAFEHEDYVEDVDGVRYVHTRGLNERLRMRGQSVSEDNAIHACLARAQAIMASIRRQDDIDERPAFNIAVRRSIVVLHGTITAFGEIYLPGQRWVPVEGAYDELNEEDVDHMLKHGWCPTAITRATYNSMSMAWKLYIKALRLDDTRDHSRCKGLDCVHAGGGQGGAMPLHVTGRHSETLYDDDNAAGANGSSENTTNAPQQAHDCSMVGPITDTVSEILLSDGLPILELTSIASGSPTVLRRSNQPYVAISHVWSHGLGNARELKLPQCQLNRLKDLIEALHGQTFAKKEDRTLYLWIDSLLCPRPGEYPLAYDKALSKMRDVYADAAYVLVLDAALQKIPYFEIDTLEAMTRIHVSDWVARLWTLQEAALPERLLVQFADVAIDYDTLKKRLPLDLAEKRVADALINSSQTMRSEFSLSKVYQSFGGRRSTFMSDHPLCAAALLKLDVEEVAKVKVIANGQIDDARTHIARMCRFWKLASPLPTSIIFSEWRKLEVPGYRWAPADMIGDGFSPKVLGNVAAAGMGKVVDGGFEVKLPCWRLKKRRDGAQSIEAKMKSDIQVLVRCQGQWFKMGDMTWERWRSGWHVLMDGEAGLRMGVVGKVKVQGTKRLLRYVPGFQDEVIPRFVQAGQVKVMPYLQAQNTMAEEASKHAAVLTQSWASWMLWLLYLVGIQRRQEFHRAKIMIALEQRSKIGEQSDEVAAAMRSQPSIELAEAFMYGHIMNCLFGKVLEVEREWTDSWWCVD